MALSFENLELSNFHNSCIEMLDSLPNNKAKHCFVSALNHLNLAQKLVSVDLSMAVFRAITAEEEAATGLMLELKNKNYKNAESLEIRNHIHKGAVIELISVIMQFLEDNFPGSFYDTTIHKVNGKLLLKLEVEMNINNERVKIIPEPPLNLCFRIGEKRFSMKQQIQILLKKRGCNTLKTHLQQKANRRNLILYASDKGCPGNPSIEKKFFPAHLKRVLAMLGIYLMVTPYIEQQQFIQDSIDLFLMMVNDIRQEDMHSEL